MCGPIRQKLYRPGPGHSTEVLDTQSRSSILLSLLCAKWLVDLIMSKLVRPPSMSASSQHYIHHTKTYTYPPIFPFIQPILLSNVPIVYFVVGGL